MKANKVFDVVVLCSILAITFAVSGCLTVPDSLSKNPQVIAMTRLANAETTYQTQAKVVLGLKTSVSSDTWKTIQQADSVCYAALTAARNAVDSGKYDNTALFDVLDAALTQLQIAVSQAQATTQKGAK